MANPTLPRPTNQARSSPFIGLAYAIVPSVALWGIIAAIIWAA